MRSPTAVVAVIEGFGQTRPTEVAGRCASARNGGSAGVIADRELAIASATRGCGPAVALSGGTVCGVSLRLTAAPRPNQRSLRWLAEAVRAAAGE
jgi:uncharacterized membrane protein YdfJ with MMPL/SSD domain